MYVLLWQRNAGVYLGLNSEAISESLRPTRPTARWVFCFAANHEFFSKGTGGEVVNARVCKTRTRGFDSRPVLQSLQRLPSGVIPCGMSQN